MWARVCELQVKAMQLTQPYLQRLKGSCAEAGFRPGLGLGHTSPGRLDGAVARPDYMGPAIDLTTRVAEASWLFVASHTSWPRRMPPTVEWENSNKSRVHHRSLLKAAAHWRPHVLGLQSSCGCLGLLMLRRPQKKELETLVRLLAGSLGN